MSHQIDPVILQKLQAFSHRRRNLIITRGVCAGVGMLLATMMVVALVDWLFVLPDWLRWTLSGVAYLAVIVVEWRSCLRLLVHAPGARRLARLVEHAEPKLREDLLSAVELGDPTSDAGFDSEQFRALVQSDVAHRMEGMEVERLLPVNLVRRYLAIAGVIVVALVAGFAVTGLQFGTLLARALFPGANLARVSQYQISIVSPDPAEKIVPHGETVPLVASVSGGRVSKAVLEVFSEGGGREVVQMTPLAGDQFSATVQVGRENVRYRVRAGDAITRKYELGAVARPHVVAFAKTYHFPKYARMADKAVSEENGDLVALEGSEVELRLKTNQAIKSGELRLDQGKQQTIVPLTAEADGQWVGRVPVSASGTYRVFLVGAQTGFENKFSPEYEIRAEPDLVPQVELELPKQDIIIPANEIVEIRGTASDDLPIARVAQMTRVNEGPWKEFVLAKDVGVKAGVERRWDLFEQGAKVNDLLTIKLMVEDLKGHRVESRPIQITIAASGFESRRLTSLEAQRALFEAIRGLRTAAEAFEKRANEARETFEKLPDGDAGRKQACVSGAGAAEEFERKAADVSMELNAALHTAGAGHESADIVLFGRMLARVKVGGLQFGKDALEIATANPATAGARDFMREFSESAARTTQRARVLEDAFRIFLNSEEIDVLAENMYVVAQQQGRLAELARTSGTDEKKWSQIAGRMRVVTSETRALEAQMTASAAHDQNGERFKEMQKEIEKYRVAVDAALALSGQVDRMLDPTLKLAKATMDASKRLLQFKRDVGNRPVEMVRNVTNEVGPTWDNFQKLREEVKAATTNDKAAPELRRMLADRRWQRRGEFLKAHGDLEELRPNPDSYFVSDVRAATLALQGLKLASDWEKGLAEMDEKFRLLESGHNLSEALDGFNHLAVNERWDIYTPRSQTSNPRDWYWLEGRMRTLPDELGKTQPPEALRKIVEEVRQILWKAQQQPAWKNVTEEMKDRFKVERTPMGLPQDVAVIASEVKRALDLLREPIAEARQGIEAMIPKISDVAEQLAKETADLKKETQQQAEKAAEQKPEEAAAAMQEKIAQQEKLNTKVDALKDLIRADANKQNVLDQEGREKARDADDALAMLKEPPPKAEAALQEAVKAEQPELREQAMHEATVQQQKLEDSLNQIAQHFENVENGKAEETRTALRATEEENGVKDLLDAQFAKAEQLAEMSQKTPEEMLKQLEAALPTNPEMRKALSQIAQDTLAGAEQKLEKASQTEQQVAKNLEQLVANPEMANATNLPQAAKNAQETAKQAVAAAENARKQADEAVQQAKKAGNQAAADQARRARAEATLAKQNAEQAAQAADQAAQQSANPQTLQQTAQTAQQAAEKAAESAKNSAAAAPAAQQAKETAQQTSAQQTGEQQANNQQTAQEAGEAVKAAQDAAQSAKTAEAAAQQLAAMAQAQTQSAKALAENLQKATENAREAVKKASAAAENARQQSEKAAQTAKAANNPAAAQQSQTAQAEATKAAQNAREAAQATEQIAQLSQNPQAGQQAAQAAQQAAQKAGEASQNAQAATAPAKQAQASAEQAAAQQSGQEQANSQQASKEAAAAALAAQQAADAAKAAQAALQQVAAMANPQSQPAQSGQQSPSPQLAQAAKQQQPIAQNAAQAGEEVSRAGRHEERLQNPLAGEQLRKLGEQIAQTAAQQVPAAQAALAQASQAKEAQAPVNAANQELANHLGQLQAATTPQAEGQQGRDGQKGQPPSAQNPPPLQLPAALQANAPSSLVSQSLPGTPGAPPASPQEQVWMARALDMLDTALNSQADSAEQGESGQPQMAQNQEGQQAQQNQPGQQGPPKPGQPGQPGKPGQQGKAGQAQDAASQAMAQAQAAMAAAAQSAANAMKSARSETPSQKPGQETKSELLDRSEGGTIAQGGKAYQTPGEAKNGKVGDWGKLPKQVAEELTQGQREAVAGEYRSQIETYYRVIAEKAKKP